MIKKEFNIKEISLKYFVGINQIKFNLRQFLQLFKIYNEAEALKYLFKLIQELQNNNKGSLIQFIKDKYLLNENHLLTACYYMQKAFYYNNNISNKKNIEFLLYLSTNRQISKGIETFGIDINDLRKGNLLFCIVSEFNNIDKINSEILRLLKVNEIELSINSLSNEKLTAIKEYYDISDNQFFTILNSYGIKYIDEKISNIDLNSISLALYDLICEKMALLNLEKIKIR
ncbi:MAG: KEOPS complex subunit Cgi121 [Promethearchaeota archaeon]